MKSLEIKMSGGRRTKQTNQNDSLIMVDMKNKSKGFASIHHTFDVQQAIEYGMEESILIHHFQHWIMVNKRLGRHFIEGRTWTYQSQEWIAAHFPYWKNRDKLRRVIKSLEKQDVIISGNFNQSSYDRTTWYAFKNEQLFLNSIYQDSQNQDPASEKCIVQNYTMECSEPNNGKCGTAQPIPDNKTRLLNQINTYAPPDGDAFACQNLSNKKLERAQDVSTTEAEHTKLLAKYGKELTDECYEELASWKKSATPSQVKKHSSDYRRITKWVALDVLERKAKETKLLKPVSTQQHISSAADTNRTWAKETFSKEDRNKIKCWQDSVEFNLHGRKVDISYHEHGFREQVKNVLEKMDLNPLRKLNQQGVV